MVERAPVSAESGATPVPELVTLDNGLRLLACPMPHARSVAISIYINAGARYEVSDPDAGLSHFVEHLCFKGTERRPTPREVAMEIDSLGGLFNAATDRELTVYYGKVAAHGAEQALDLLADAVQHSLFHDEEIERERRVILEELAAVEDAPDEQASLALDGLLWPDQPIGRDVAGTAASVTGIGADRLRAYYHEQYTANAAVVAVAGAIEPAHLHEMVQSVAGEWASGDPAAWVRARHDLRGDRVRLVTKETEQAYVSVGMRGLDARDDDRYALGLFSVLLGEGMSSRLFLRLREELGLCYDVHTSTSFLQDAGTFSVHAGVDPTNAEATIAELSLQLAHARTSIDADELERAKQQVRSRVELQLEESRAVSAWYGTRAALGMPLIDPDEAIASFDDVTVDDVERVAQRLIVEDELHLAVVGPMTDQGPLEAQLRLHD